MRSLIEDKKLETELASLSQRLLNFRCNLKDILRCYNVHNPEEIKDMIEAKKVDEHPSYEDYLDAVGFKTESELFLKEIESRIQEIKSTI